MFPGLTLDGIGSRAAGIPNGSKTEAIARKNWYSTGQQGQIVPGLLGFMRARTKIAMGIRHNEQVLRQRQAAGRRCRRTMGATTRGFTLIELVTILMLVGVLAIAVVPRFFDSEDFASLGLYDETTSALRYAQKAAIAKRRTVCVTFTTTTLTFSLDTSATGQAACTTTVPMSGPHGTAPFTVTARRSATYTNVGGATITPTAFSINPLGAPSFTSAYTFRVKGLSRNITIEPETGYVHA